MVNDMDKKLLHILQHSLGLDQYGNGRQYRNHFVTGPGSKDFDDCRALVSEGMMMEGRAPTELTGGMQLFIVTPKGVDFVALNSPEPPKLTRSQKRYREFLESDCGYSFGEWLRCRG